MNSSTSAESEGFANSDDRQVVGLTRVRITNVAEKTETSKKRSKNSTIKPKRGQANKRERVRTENVNVGFDNLRKLIPTEPEDRKLSKIEVLRLATSYINHLYNLTRANSCLEAEADATRLLQETDEEEGQENDVGVNMDSDANIHIINSNKYHVCTFCLMKTKTATKPTAGLASSKRK